jgi:hypothetical protein
MGGSPNRPRITVRFRPPGSGPSAIVAEAHSGEAARPCVARPGPGSAASCEVIRRWERAGVPSGGLAAAAWLQGRGQGLKEAQAILKCARKCLDMCRIHREAFRSFEISCNGRIGGGGMGGAARVAFGRFGKVKRIRCSFGESEFVQCCMREGGGASFRLVSAVRRRSSCGIFGGPASIEFPRKGICMFPRLGFCGLSDGRSHRNAHRAHPCVGGGGPEPPGSRPCDDIRFGLRAHPGRRAVLPPSSESLR